MFPYLRSFSQPPNPKPQSPNRTTSTPLDQPTQPPSCNQCGQTQCLPCAAMKRDTLRNDIAHCDHYIRILEDMISSERAKLRAVLGNGKRLDEEITVGRNVNAKDPLVEEKMKKVEVVEFLEKSIEKLRDKVRDLEAVRTTSRGELEMVEWRLGEGRLVYEGKEGKKEAARRMVEGFRKKREEGRVVHKRVWGVVEGDGCDCCLGMKGE